MTEEAVASGTGLVGASACAECLTTWGLDPTIAGAVAVLVGVAARLSIDWYQRWRVQRDRKEQKS